MNFNFYQQLKIQQATTQSIIDDAIDFLYTVAKNEKTLAGKLPEEYSAFILKLRALYKNHPTFYDFYKAVLSELQTGSLFKLSMFFKSLLNDHSHIMTTNNYTADEAVCLLNQCIDFKKAHSIECYHYSAEIDGLLDFIAALSKQDLSSNNELKDFNLSVVQKLKKDTAQHLEYIAELMADLEQTSATVTSQSIHEILLTLPLAFDYTQPLPRQLPADSSIHPIIDKFPHQTHNLLKALQSFEKAYMKAQDRAKSIDNLLATTGGRRLNYLDQSLEKAIHFYDGFCYGGVYTWAQESPPGVQFSTKEDQKKSQLKTYSDLNNSRLTAKLFKIQQNQFTTEQRARNTAHYATQFSTINFCLSVSTQVASIKWSVQDIMQFIKTAKLNYDQYSQDIPTIAVNLSKDGRGGHALGLKIFKFEDKSFYRFID